MLTTDNNSLIQRAYNRHIHWNSYFWNKIIDRKEYCFATPKKMAARIRTTFMNKSPMLRLFVGPEITGALCADFENLAKEIQYLKTYETAKDYILRWRRKSADGENHKRIPEDQSKLFTGNKWSKFKKESKEDEQHT